MSVIWRKVWFDLTQNRSRTALTVLSIAAGVFAVGAIFGMIDQLLSGMDHAHRAVDPSHVTVVLRGYVDRETAAAVRDLPGVADVEPANQITVRYKLDPAADWETGIVVSRADYEQQTYDRLTLQDGDWPSAGSLGIERLSGQFFGASLGDEIILEIGQNQQVFPISGEIRHPFVQPPPFGGRAHFFADGATLEALGVPAGRYGQLALRTESYSLERARDVAGEVRAELAQQGTGVAVVLYQSPDEHWGRRFVEGVNLVLQVMAVVSLFMSVVLVLNALTALVTQQTDQIGVIKAIGGRRRTIIRLYLSGALVYGGLALLVALPGAHLMSDWFLNLFNVDVAAFQISGRAVGLMAGAALLAPLAAALAPVLRGAAITVREALNSYGIGADYGSSRLDRAVDALGRRTLPTAHAAALGNVFRRKSRLTLTLLVLVVAGLMFMVVMSLISSTTATLDNEMARQRYDVRLGLNQDQPVGVVEALLAESDDVDALEVWFGRNATMLRAGERLQDSAGLGAQLTGIPTGSDFYKPLITAGRWLTPDDERAVVLSAETAEANGIAMGDTLTLDLGRAESSAWDVVGLYRAVYGSNFVTEPIYANRAAVLSAAAEDRVVGTTVLVRTGADSLTRSVAIADDLKARLQAEGIGLNAYTTTVKLEERAFADTQFGSVTSMLLSLALLVATVGGIGLMGALGISVVERTREIGVMRAVGARDRTIMSLFIMEGMLQGLLSWLLAIPLSWLLAPPLTRLLGETMIGVALDFAYDWTAVGLWLVLVLVIAAVAAVGPARRATRISVRESLAYS